MRLLLFDIDLTLVAAKPLPGKLGSMFQTFLDRYGLPDAEFQPCAVAGRTDRAIVASLHQAHGIPYDEGRDYEPFMQQYLQNLEKACLQGERPPLPGARELVLALASRPDAFVLGLVTGNDQRGAKIKLECCELWDPFVVGAFGDESTNREHLVKLAIGRAESLVGLRFPLNNIVVIGDSPLDVQAAKGCGVTCVAVLTGHHDEKTLKANGPCQVIPDLVARDAILDLLGRENTGLCRLNPNLIIS